MNEFEIGNKAAEKWTEAEVKKTIEQMRENAHKDSEILCLQDAIFSVDLYSSGLNYLIDKFPVFENIKKDIQDIIISRINKGALKGDLTPSPAIWRMKQCGEKDKVETEHSGEIKGNRIDIEIVTPEKSELDIKTPHD